MRSYSLKYIFFSFFMTLISAIHSVPDLTIVGFLEPEGGLGKLPISILECLGEDISANFIQTDSQSSARRDVTELTIKALTNPDNKPGKVAILTDMLCDVCRDPSKKMPGKSIVKLAYSMLETTKIPKIWTAALNQTFDAVIVPDEYLVKVYQNSGVNIPIYVLPIPMLLDPYVSHPPHDINPRIPFIFADASANKNPSILIEAFAQAFNNNPDIHLIMRAKNIDTIARNRIQTSISKYSLTNITIEDGDLPLNEWIKQLSNYDCYVNLSRGEGFSFIPREALALGIPVIITDNTASTTICKTGFVRAVPSNVRGPSNWVYKALFNDECGKQFDCSVEDAKVALLDVYNNYATYIEKARAGREWVSQYDRANSTLRKNYQTLVKPKKVVLGKKNTIKNGIIYTNSPELFKKYNSIIPKKSIIQKPRYLRNKQRLDFT